MCLSYIYTHTVSTVVYVNLYEVHVRTGLMQFLNTEIHVMLHVSFPMSSNLAWFGLYGPNDNPWPRSFQLIAKRDEVWHFACQDCVWIMRTCDDCDQDWSFLILCKCLGYVWVDSMPTSKSPKTDWYLDLGPYFRVLEIEQTMCRKDHFISQ